MYILGKKDTSQGGVAPLDNSGRSSGLDYPYPEVCVDLLRVRSFGYSPELWNQHSGREYPEHPELSLRVSRAPDILTQSTSSQSFENFVRGYPEL